MFHQKVTYSQVFVSVARIVVLLVHQLLDNAFLVFAESIAQSLKQLRAHSLAQSLAHYAYFIENS